MKHLGTKVLHTKRLTLRPFTVDDAQEMYDNWASDPEVTKYLTWTPHASVEDTRSLLKIWAEESKKPESYNWAIVFHDNAKDVLIGKPLVAIIANPVFNVSGLFANGINGGLIGKFVSCRRCCNRAVVGYFIVAVLIGKPLVAGSANPVLGIAAFFTSGIDC